MTLSDEANNTSSIHNNNNKNTNTNTNNTNFVVDLTVVTSSEETEALESMETGKIDQSVYFAYFQSAGWGLSVGVLVTTIVMQISSTCMGLW